MEPEILIGEPLLLTASQGVCGPVAPTAPENLLENQTPQPHHRPTESESAF